MRQSTNVLTIVALAVPLVVGQPLTVSTPLVQSKVRHFQQTDMHGVAKPVTFSATVGQAYFWAPQWQKQEALASKDLREGRFEDFETAEDAISWLFGDEA